MYQTTVGLGEVSVSDTGSESPAFQSVFQGHGLRGVVLRGEVEEEGGQLQEQRAHRVGAGPARPRVEGDRRAFQHVEAEPAA